MCNAVYGYVMMWIESGITYLLTYFIDVLRRSREYLSFIMVSSIVVGRNRPLRTGNPRLTLGFRKTLTQRGNQHEVDSIKAKALVRVARHIALY